MMTTHTMVNLAVLHIIRKRYVWKPFSPMMREAF